MNPLARLLTKLFNKPKLCLPLFTFLYLCSNNASMHKFCACLILCVKCNVKMVYNILMNMLDCSRTLHNTLGRKNIEKPS